MFQAAGETCWFALVEKKKINLRDWTCLKYPLHQYPYDWETDPMDHGESYDLRSILYYAAFTDPKGSISP